MCHAILSSFFGFIPPTSEWEYFWVKNSLTNWITFIFTSTHTPAAFPRTNFDCFRIAVLCSLEKGKTPHEPATVCRQKWAEVRSRSSSRCRTRERTPSSLLPSSWCRPHVHSSVRTAQPTTERDHNYHSIFYFPVSFVQTTLRQSWDFPIWKCKKDQTQFLYTWNAQHQLSIASGENMDSPARERYKTAAQRQCRLRSISHQIVCKRLLYTQRLSLMLCCQYSG